MTETKKEVLMLIKAFINDKSIELNNTNSVAAGLILKSEIEILMELERTIRNFIGNKKDEQES